MLRLNIEAGHKEFLCLLFFFFFKVKNNSKEGEVLFFSLNSLKTMVFGVLEFG